MIPTWLFNFYRTVEPSSKVENTVGFLLVLVLTGWCYGYFQNKIPIHMKMVTDLEITMQFLPVLFMCLVCMSGEALVGLFHSVLHVCQFEWDKICDNKLILYFVKWVTPCGGAWRWHLRKNCNKISIGIEGKHTQGRARAGGKIEVRRLEQRHTYSYLFLDHLARISDIESRTSPLSWVVICAPALVT